MLSLQPFPKGHACCICTLLPRPLGPPAQALGAGEQLPWRNVRILRCESPHPSSMTYHGSPLPLRSVPRPTMLSPGSSLQPPCLSPLPQLPDRLHSPRLTGWPAARAFAYPSCLNCPAAPCHSSGDSLASSRKLSHTPTQDSHCFHWAVPGRRAGGSVSTSIPPTGSRTPRAQGQGHQDPSSPSTGRAGRSSTAHPLSFFSPSASPSSRLTLPRSLPALLSTALPVSSSLSPSFPES